MLFKLLVAGCIILVVSGASISVEQGSNEDVTVRKLRNNRHKRQLDWYYPSYASDYYYPQYDPVNYPYYEPEYYPQYYPKYEPVTYPKYEPVHYPKYEPVHYPKHEPVYYPKHEPVHYPKYETTPYPKYETKKPCKTTTPHYYTTTPPPPPPLIPSKLGLVNQLGNDKQNLLNTKLGLLLGTTTVAPYHYY